MPWEKKDIVKYTCTVYIHIHHIFTLNCHSRKTVEKKLSFSPCHKLKKLRKIEQPKNTSLSLCLKIALSAIYFSIYELIFLCLRLLSWYAYNWALLLGIDVQTSHVQSLFAQKSQAQRVHAFFSYWNPHKVGIGTDNYYERYSSFAHK